MSMTDPVADLLTRIRNAQRAGLEELVLPASKLKQKVAEVLRDEGFVREVTYAKGDGPQGTLKVVLKYDEEKRPAISEIRRQSKPGLVSGSGSGTTCTLMSPALRMISCAAELRTSSDQRERCEVETTICVKLWVWADMA